MKTKFFKKLSFVLAVAMVLSVFAPAAGAFAAGEPKLNSTKKYLHLSGKPGSNEFNFNIKNKVKGWKYFWESADEAVAEVNEKNGVVIATGVGKTKITCTITDADGEEVAELVATVTVRDNIETVTIKNPVEKLNVGEEHDYNRSFVTLSGSTKKTSSVTRWTVEPEGAEIDDKGVFKASAPGKYTVTALSFQSKAKYDDWKADPEKYADYVLDTDTTKVVVSANIVGITQVDKNIINVEFDSSMKDADLSDKTIVISRLINGKLYNTGVEKVKSVTLDATEKIATVETYGNFTGKAEYQFAYGDLKDNFTAADADIKEVAGLIFEDFQVLTNGTKPVDLYSKVKAVNSAGVVILHGNDLALKPFLSFEYKGDVNYGWIINNEAYITKNGETAQFDVKYVNHIFDDATKTYKLVEHSASAIGVGVDVIIENTTLQYAVKQMIGGSNVNPNEYDSDTWFANGFTVPAGDETYGIYAKYKKNDKDAYVVSPIGDFVYVSTDTDKMVIHGNYMYPIAQGVVTVLVKDTKNNNAIIGAFDVTIKAPRTYLSAIPDTNQASLGNADLGVDSESRRLAVTNTDSMNSPTAVTVTNSDIELINYPDGGAGAALITVDSIPGVGAWDYGKAYFNVSAIGAKPGTYTYKVTLGALNSTKTVYFYVTVLDGSDTDVVPGGWRVEMSSSKVDLKEQKGEKTIKANVYGYNSKNARVKVLPISDYEIAVVKSGTNTGIKFGVDGNNIPLAKYTSGTALEFVDLATYQVTAKSKTDGNATGRDTGVIINRNTFTVEDTIQKSVDVKKRSVSAGVTGKISVRDALKEALVVKLNWGDIKDDWANVSFEYTLGGTMKKADDGSTLVNAGESIFVSKVLYSKSHDSGTSVITYTYDVNTTITIAK